MEHTPGPWTYLKTGYISCVEPPGDFEYTMMSPGKTAAEIKANGLLIAAAPDLLKALKDIRYSIRTGLLYKRIQKGSAEELDCVARQAIAKATE